MNGFNRKVNRPEVIEYIQTEQVGPTAAAEIMGGEFKATDLTMALAMMGYVDKAPEDNTSKAKWWLNESGVAKGFYQKIVMEDKSSGSIIATFSLWASLSIEVGGVSAIRRAKLVEKAIR